MPPVEPVFVVLLAVADAAALESLRPTAEILAGFGIGAETATILDVGTSGARFDGMCAVVVASPEGALPAAVAAMTRLPVIRVPTATPGRGGLSPLQDETGRLPAGAGESPFAPMAIGEAGAKNAALFVVATLALADERLREEYAAFRARQTAEVLNQSRPEL